MQSGDFQGLTPLEKSACKALDLSDTVSRGIVVQDNTSAHELLQALSKKKLHVNIGTSPFINAYFILGSTADMKRVWSIAKYLSLNTRKCMEPVLFEALFSEYASSLLGSKKHADNYGRSKER